MTEAPENDKRTPLVEQEAAPTPAVDSSEDTDATEEASTDTSSGTSSDEPQNGDASTEASSDAVLPDKPSHEENQSGETQSGETQSGETQSGQSISKEELSEEASVAPPPEEMQESSPPTGEALSSPPPSAESPDATFPTAAEPVVANQPESAAKAPEVEASSTDQEESEADESDEEEQDADEDEEVDYSAYSKEELAAAAVQLAKGEPTKEAYAHVQQMKTYFDALEEEDRQAALEVLLAEDGEEEGFDYKPDAYSIQFYQAYRHILEQRSAKRKSQKKQEQENLKAKEALLDKLREFLDNDETQVSINWIKEVQAEWRAIGNVPAQHNRTLWANYNALMDRFYNNRSIYFELKELDRRKNLELKQVLCERAEALKDVEDVREAVRQLDELHEEYKHVGPVPQEEQEPLWQRFKTASDQVHNRRRAEVEKFKEELNENLAKKESVAEEVAPFVDFNSESIKEWNQKTKEIQELQKKWTAIGSMPRGKAKEVNKKFWTPFKEFFAHKSEFFKRLDQAREGNLQKKEALVAQAEAVKASTDWRNTAQKLKDLQQEWKTIGPVPGRVREEIYQRFRAACDHFFEQRRSSHQEQDNEYAQNLKAKQEVCAQIEQMTKSGINDTQKLVELSDRFAAIGFVPRNAMKSIAQRFEKAVAAFLKQAEVDESEKKEVQSEVALASLKNSPDADRKIDRKESSLQRKISQLEDDIALWENNMSFFAASNKANKLKADFEKRIEDARQEVDTLKSQLKAVRNIR